MKFVYMIISLIPVLIVIFLCTFSFIVLGSPIALFKSGKEKLNQTKPKGNKDDIMKDVIANIHESDMEIDFDSNRGITYESACEIYPARHDHHYTSEDLLFGTIKGQKFESSDVFCWHYSTDDNHVRRRVTGFKGRYFIIENDHFVNSPVFIHREPETVAKLTFIYSKGYEIVSTESSKFNELYNVYSNDAIEALKIIKPHTMEYLISFAQKFDYAKILIKVFDNKIHIMVNNLKDNFTYYGTDNDFEKLLKETQLEISCIKDFYQIFVQ